MLLETVWKKPEWGRGVCCALGMEGATKQVIDGACLKLVFGL